jgi:alkyl sulfatase BDS1-like metallo-beta-lactamase superfamily hydrolase
MADATIRLSREILIQTLLSGADAAALVQRGDIAVTGKPDIYPALTRMIDPIVANFPIVTP